MLEKGKIYEFGSYPQSSDVPEPIKWDVLDVKDGKALLVSHNVLDAHRFDGESNNYKNSEIRKWLNEDFYNKAFGDKEKERILTTEIDNSARSTNAFDNSKTFNKDGSNQYSCDNTQDKVFLLSHFELTDHEYGFSSSGENDSNRQKKATAYALKNKVNGENAWYYTRSAAFDNCEYTLIVNSDGKTNFCASVNGEDGGVLPAIWINENEDLEALNLNKGDTFKFGRYPQSSDTPEPIEWDVLAVNNGKALLFAKNILDAHRFSESSNNYANSEIRNWLNNQFLNQAFNSQEQERILVTEVDNSVRSTNPYSDENFYNHGINNHVCENTNDKVFLLSINEITNSDFGFNASAGISDLLRRKTVTLYAKSKGAYSSSLEGYTSCGWYFLRSPYYDNDNSAKNCNIGGNLDGEYNVNSGYSGVVPAMWINIEEIKAFKENLNENQDTDVSEETEIHEESEVLPQTEVNESKANIKKGDIYKFGSYPQSSDIPEPLEWEVLDVVDGKALLFATKILDAHRFDGNSNNYANSEIRSWLNNEFLNKAFNEEEQERILVTDVDNSERSTNTYNNPTRWNNGKNQYACKNTQDKIFLLSEYEITNPNYGFNEDPDNEDIKRRKQVTAYAKKKGAWISTSNEYKGNGCFYLRSPDYDDADYAYGVGGDGDSDGFRSVSSTDSGAVPALWVKIDDIQSEQEIVDKPFTQETPKLDVQEEKIKIKKGDFVKFGNYPQSSDTPEPIEWDVLDVVDGKALLFAHKILDAHRFDEKSNNYANSEIRTWLNNEFLNKAFSAEEQNRILVTEVDNSERSSNPYRNANEYNNGKNPYYCSNTQDMLFLLSEYELTNPYYGFNEDPKNSDLKRRKQVTEYAIKHGAENYGNRVWYFRRSPCSGISDYACCVQHDGDSDLANNVRACLGVVPALWIKI